MLEIADEFNKRNNKALILLNVAFSLDKVLDIFVRYLILLLLPEPIVLNTLQRFISSMRVGQCYNDEYIVTALGQATCNTLIRLHVFLHVSTLEKSTHTLHDLSSKYLDISNT